jgi:serine/threonine protein kinase/tetratricopeptide (TPR) repeat protein
MTVLGFWFQRDYAAKADEAYRKGELQKAAELYLRAERHEQAAGVFAELGETAKAVDAYLAAPLPLKAAELLDRLGDHRGAITQYEKAGAYRQAAEAAVKARQLERAGRNYEKASMYRRAAQSFAEVGLHEPALRAWELEIHQLHQRDDAASPAIQHEILEIEMLRAEVLENLGRYGQAAEILRRHGVGTALRSARLFLRDKRYAEAAEAFLEANRAPEALDAVEKAADADDALRATIYLRCDRYSDAGEILERMGRGEEAAAAFEQAEVWDRAAELFEKAENPKQAAEHFFRAGRYADAARCYAKVNMHREAAAAYLRLNDYEHAAEAYRAADMPLYAGNYYLKARRRTQAFELLQTIPTDHEDYVQASLLLVPLLLNKDMIEGAEHRLETLRREKKEGRLALPGHIRWYLEGRIEEAKKNWEAAAVCYEKVIAEKHAFQDTTGRLTAARALAAGAEAPRRSRPPSGTISTELVLHPPVFGAIAPDLTGQPFVIRSQLEPWWQGVSVFEAIDRRGKKPMLMVSFPQSFAGEPENLRHTMGRFSGFGLESVLTLHEVVLAHGNVLLLYEPFRALTLARRLAQGPLPHAVGLGILRQISDALATSHKVNITHQWLSPRALLVDEKNRVKLVGLGLAGILAHHDQESRAYLSPETRKGEEGSPASDLYSLGLLGVELLRAYMPANRASSSLDPKAVSWPREAEEAVPRTVRNLLLRCLRAKALERPSAEELRSALGAVGLLPGQLLLDRYEIQGELGRGGMSRVYRAHDRQFDEEVAIKTMINLAAESSDERERLFREVQICRKISHPNVVRVHDFGQLADGIFVIMEYLDGPGLDEVIDSQAPLPLERAREVLREIAAALAEAHRLKVVHRDLKPGNVILVDGRVKVLDFGIAHMNDGVSKQLTKAGEVVGSPLYMSPEQIQGQPVDGTCDLYALGVIAYNLLTGHEPFEAETATAVVFKHLNEPPPDVRAHRPDLPHGWIDVLARLLAKTPADRYQSAEELIRALSALPV